MLTRDWAIFCWNSFCCWIHPGFSHAAIKKLNTTFIWKNRSLFPGLLWIVLRERTYKLAVIWIKYSDRKPANLIFNHRWESVLNGNETMCMTQSGIFCFCFLVAIWQCLIVLSVRCFACRRWKASSSWAAAAAKAGTAVHWVCSGLSSLVRHLPRPHPAPFLPFLGFWRASARRYSTRCGCRSNLLKHFRIKKLVCSSKVLGNIFFVSFWLLTHFYLDSFQLNRLFSTGLVSFRKVSVSSKTAFLRSVSNSFHRSLSKCQWLKLLQESPVIEVRAVGSLN